MIAMALSCSPDILIADEPTTALDVTIQAQIVELTKRLQDELGMAVIWITHDLGVIAELADQHGGDVRRLCCRRSRCFPAYMKTRCHPYTLSLLKSLPRVDSSRGECPPGNHSLDFLPMGSRSCLAVRCARAAAM